MSQLPCTIDSYRLASLLPCMIDDGQLLSISQYIDFDPFSDPDGFPFCCISKRAIVYSCGIVAHQGDTVLHDHDPSELDLCLTLSSVAAKLMEGVCADWGSEGTPRNGTDFFLPFFRTAIQSNLAETVFTNGFIRAIFGGTLNPACEIAIEPLSQQSIWWQNFVRAYGSFDSSYRDSTLDRWSMMINWLSNQTEFAATSFVQIREPHGNGGSVFPQFALGLTHRGSVAGIVGAGVHT